jgi:hypothetical protein
MELPLLLVSLTCVDTSEVLSELRSMMFVVDCTIKFVVGNDITPHVVSMVVEGGDVGVTSVHVTLTIPFPPAGKTKYVY